jgi:alpha-1,2-mannosyltransferase
MWLAFKRVYPLVVFGVFPVVALVLLVHSFRQTGNGPDFRYELYPEAKAILHGSNPFPAPDADLSQGGNQIYPPLAGVLVAPLTVFSVGVATGIFAVLLFGALMVTAWVVGLRDWRIYGLIVLWPASLAAIQSGNLTLILSLLVAVAWRYRDRRYVPGVAIGLAIALKLFLWPLLVWLLARRSYRAAAAGAAIGIAGILAVLPFTSLSDFLRVEAHLGDTFGPGSLTIGGLLFQAHASAYGTGTIVAALAGLAVLVLAYTRRSLPLAVTAALLLSPIVWLHYFALLLVPLAARQPRLAAVWLIPLALWPCPGTVGEIHEWHVVLALTTLAVVTVLIECGPGPLRGLVRRRRRVAEVAKPVGL